MPRDAVNRVVRAWTPKKPSAHATKLPRTFKSAFRCKSAFLRGLDYGAPWAIYCGDVDVAGWMLSYFFEALMTIPGIADILWRACRASSVDSIYQVAKDWEANIEGLPQDSQKMLHRLLRHQFSTRWNQSSRLDWLSADKLQH